jgi:DNA-binding transcriptional ArsR family regulator
MKETVKLLKALANERRLKILRILNNESKSSGDLGSDLHISFKAVSKHLQKLKDTGLVVSEQRGFKSYYSLSNNIDSNIKKIIDSI